MHSRHVTLTVGLAVAAVTIVACGDESPPAAAPEPVAEVAPITTTAPAPAPIEGAVIDPGDGGRYQPAVDPANFVETVTNPYFPLAPGSRWVYEGTDDGGTERIEVVVQTERRTVMGISAVVVRDTVTLDGELVEDTDDWYAQDRQGNVWYLGEDTAEYDDGEVVSTAGAWEAGVDGALPGIVMPAAPKVGDAYRQEFYAGEAEDLAEVLAVDGSETVAYGPVDHLLVTEEWTPLQPDVVENKYYAPGIGLVLEVKRMGGEGRIELIEFAAGRLG